MCGLAKNYDDLRGNRKASVYSMTKPELIQICEAIKIQIPKGRGAKSFGQAFYEFVIDNCPEHCIFC